MRPDEHKKRKNTQYKKKHGISGKDDKQESDGKKASTDKSSKDKSQSKNDKPPVAQVDKETKGKVKEKTVNLEPEHDDFRRRKLMSNWTRYDESDDDNDEDVPTQRGEDFNKLLAEAGGSAAQFRLKDEEDWTEDQTEGGNSVLALDLDNLAESLSCVELHERLGIDQNLLTEEQVDEIKAVASDNQRTYYLKFPKHSSDLTNDNKPALKSSTDNNNIKKKSNSLSTVVPKNDTVDVEINKTDNVQTLDKNSSSTCNTETQSKSKNKEILSLEDDLDMLLSLDEPKGVSGNTVSHCKPHNDTDQAKNTDKTKTSAGSVTETAALEDWLDSMLDD